MKKTSIFLWITLIFLLAFIGIGGAYFLSIKYISTANKYQTQRRLEFIAQSLIWQLGSYVQKDLLFKNLERLELLPILYPKEAEKILKKTKFIKRIRFPIGQVLILKDKNNYYFLVQSYGNVLLLKDISKNLATLKLIYTAIFGLMVVLLLIIYLLIIYKLRPLKKITKEIEKFSSGKLDLDLNIQGFKEINEVAQALQDASNSLKNIQNSRKLLLRNIMHELKTPITKGRIQAEMVEDQKQKERLVHIFEKLNSLINELAAIEAVNAKIKPNYEKIKASDLIQEAVHIGMFDKKDLVIDIEADPTIEGDYKLLAIALKNLIDNAIKYSTDGKAKIVVTQSSIQIHNKAPALSQDLSYYLEPFSKENKRSGFGLGLYLVDNILRMHNFKLSYKHEDGENIFIITFTQ
ncbi:ArsS family sensor histidine kinase [Nitratiruptor sp. YY09-18]|uniref:ArsS family sensor histidine kinase n=1 Tax=Nitratiruptor sp. YY09-18 TaxID=2724901 RepID=UPI0019157941|nr:ArsS family sensor histidine kinase [Nitratiruptor sp. YY09-18]BCD68825.1 two-component system, OmpR family, sensor kinase [Nitratiruptor sp. YY09-18]